MKEEMMRDGWAHLLDIKKRERERIGDRHKSNKTVGLGKTNTRRTTDSK